MKRTKTGQPYLSWCIIARNTAKTLETTLKSVRARTPDAEIVVVDTMSNDNGATWAIAEKYADVLVEYAGPKGDWTREMEWFDDAAAARNHAYSLASGVWKAWIDSDDELLGPDETAKLLAANGQTPAPRDGKSPSAPAQVMGLEDVLRVYEQEKPEIDCLFAPYLYRFDSEGVASTWQTRERFTRNHDRWTWRGEAHEVLVQVDPAYRPPLGYLASLLFVHRKEFSVETDTYALRRHFDVLTKKLQRDGTLSTTEFLYLENYATFVCPTRRGEFIKLAYDAASTPTERYKALIRHGNYSVEQGFYLDAVEAFAGATTLRPDLPDAWIASGDAYSKAGSALQSAEAYAKAARVQRNAIETEIPPRVQDIECRLHAVEELRKGAKSLVQQGNTKLAEEALDQATILANTALASATGQDTQFGVSRVRNLVRNEADAMKIAKAIQRLHRYLVLNDETEKAAKLLDVLPHNLQDHPVALDLEKFAAKIQKHFTDPAAYQTFYESQELWGAIPSDMKELTYETTVPRVRFLIDWIKKERPKAKILEMGAFDGNIAFPVLRSCPEVFYTAVEAQQVALDRMSARAKELGVESRLAQVHSLGANANLPPMAFDAVVLFEVIEHVPDPVATIRDLLRYVVPGGRLFVSTPWGSFDRGAPDNIDVRDPRGHVRAMTPRDLHAVVAKAGGRIVEQGGVPGAAGFSATTHTAIEPMPQHRPWTSAKPVTFAVCSALWDWNASHVIETGIGASEETIVYLAQAIASEGKTEVYGPLPEKNGTLLEETRDGVSYWPREQLRKIPEGGTVVVSRAPSFGKTIDEVTGRTNDKVLWLQDAYYPDLNPETAALYRRIVVLTDWHRDAMHRLHGAPHAKMDVIGNFLLADQFKDHGVKRKPHHFVYASSPDRGLIPLLRMWPAILARWPDATLDIFYGWEGCMKLGAGDPAWVKRYRKIRTEYLQLCYQPGIRERGRVNHETIARELQSAAAYLYPGDPATGAFAETFCSSAIKARAAGAVMVCTPFAGLTTSAACPETRFVELTSDAQRYQEAFVDAVAEAVDTGPAARADMSEQAIAEWRLEAILPKWKAILPR